MRNFRGGGGGLRNFRVEKFSGGGGVEKFFGERVEKFQGGLLLFWRGEGLNFFGRGWQFFGGPG